jgi:glycosyltransferase involved in cell wall biosynthesis
MQDRAIYIDVTHLYNIRGPLTGISRVISKFAEFLLTEHSDLEVYGMRLFPQHITVVSRHELGRLLLTVNPSCVVPHDMKTDTPDIEKGDILLALGEQWLYPQTIDLYQALQKEKSISLVTLINDIVPFFNPEYYEAGFAPQFVESVTRMVSLSSGIVTISNWTQKDVLQYLAEALRPGVKMATVICGADNNSVTPLDTAKAPTEPYVMVVSTIQPRKNHMLLYYVWSRLIQENKNVPKLLLVGSVGWHVSDFLHFVKSNPILEDRIEILENVEDEDLAALYKNCLFTIYPSFYEGWGIPISESLRFGKVCLASGSSAMPEAGQNFADYFSPYDSNELFKLVQKYVDHPNLLKQRESEIAKSYRSPTWSKAVDDLVQFVRELPFA